MLGFLRQPNLHELNTQMGRIDDPRGGEK